jgi:hypothetical protein
MRLLPAALVVSTCSLAGVVLLPRPDAAPLAPLFTDDERRAFVAYWNMPGRMVVDLPTEAAQRGAWTVRLTPEGSEWLLRYQRIVTGGRKIPPSESVGADSVGSTAGWEDWLKAKVSYDRAAAQQTVALANGRLLPSGTIAGAGLFSPPPVPTPAAAAAPLPPAPGPAPSSLIATCGNPPAFARAVVPMQYSVRLDSPDETFVYVDNVKLPDRYAYYRFPQGVVSYGTFIKDMPEAQRASRFRDAGFSPSERRIFSAVSGLEGGFETVQTYDTGFVSVGFIQFVTLAEGKHDLCKVLRQEKRDAPDAFQTDFRRFGIDVRPEDDLLTVVDPATGAELTGPDAVKKIVDDKRLVAVFQRAGRHSTAFQVAQIKVARSFYWPSADPISVTLPDGSTCEGTLGDIITSEAGLATILDRKINTGNVRPLADVVADVLASHGGKKFADVKPYEREIVTRMKYRKDFLADRSLGQPPLPPRPVRTRDKSGTTSNSNLWDRFVLWLVG